MKKRILVILLAPILGAAIGYSLTSALDNGWLSTRWQKIEPPPGKVERLAAVDQEGLYVQTNSGLLL